MFRFVSFIVSLVLLWGCEGGAESELERILITAWPIQTMGADELTLAEGNSQPFKAIGVYSNGLARPLEELNIHNWVSSDNDVGFFSEPGLLVGGSTPGEIEVTAHLEGITSNPVNVTITDAEIVTLTVTPDSALIPIGFSVQFEALAVYDDGTSYNKTKDSEWNTPDKSIAIINTSGLVTGEGVGPSYITATNTLSGESAIHVTNEEIESISITPQKSTLLANFPQQLTAIGTFNGRPIDITNDVIWSVIDEGVSISSTQPGEIWGKKVSVPDIEGDPPYDGTCFDPDVENSVCYVDATVRAQAGNEKIDTEYVRVCNDLGRSCIDVFDLGDNNLYTSSPSIVFLDDIDYSSFYPNSIYSTTSDKSGSGEGKYKFAIFKDKSDADSLCSRYNDMTLAGRENWRVPKTYELQFLWARNGSMDQRMWPVSMSYISNNSSVNLSNPTNEDIAIGYVSCISSPPE